MQNYLKPNRVMTYQDQIKIFSYISEVVNDISLKYNEIQDSKVCVCTKELNNSHLYECITLNNGEELELKYEDIFNGTLHQQKYVLSILKKNLAIYTKIILAAQASN